MEIKFSYPAPESAAALRSTVCRIYFDNLLVLTGTTHCSSKDIFSKSEGRRWSLTKALTGLPKITRAAIWEHYWKVYGKKDE